jgi:hypothetical protein
MADDLFESQRSGNFLHTFLRTDCQAIYAHSPYCSLLENCGVSRQARQPRAAPWTSLISEVCKTIAGRYKSV